MALTLICGFRGREALAFHIDGLIRGGDPVPVPAMSVDDAIAFHAQTLADADAELLADYRDAAATLSTRFETVEVEISTPQATLVG